MKKSLIYFVLIVGSCTYLENKKSDDVLVNNIAKTTDSLGVLNGSPVDTLKIFEALKENQIASEESKLEIVSQLPSIGEYLFAIVNESNNMCENAYLICLVGDKIHSFYMVKSNCDSDLSYFKYEYWDYELTEDSGSINVLKLSETVKNKDLIDANGFILNGKNREDSDLIMDTLKITLKTKDLINQLKYFPHLNQP